LPGCFAAAFAFGAGFEAGFAVAGGFALGADFGFFFGLGAGRVGLRAGCFFFGAGLVAAFFGFGAGFLVAVRFAIRTASSPTSIGKLAARVVTRPRFVVGDALG